MTSQDEEFEGRLRALLEQSAGELPGHVRSRLTQARHAALAVRRPAVHAAWRSWAPAGAIAASALLAVMIFAGRGVPPGGGAALTAPAAEAPGAFDDLELIADNDALELANADEYDFYEWAAEQGSDGGGGEEVGS